MLGNGEDKPRREGVKRNADSLNAGLRYESRWLAFAAILRTVSRSENNAPQTLPPEEKHTAYHSRVPLLRETPPTPVCHGCADTCARLRKTEPASRLNLSE